MTVIPVKPAINIAPSITILQLTVTNKRYRA